MRFVLDNSVVVGWFLEDQATPYTDAIGVLLEQDQAVVPALWELEFANVLRTACRKERLTADEAHQIIVEAQAHGTGSEQELLLPTIHASRAVATADTLYTADAGYHSETNLKSLAEENIPALIADNGMRKRDERFKDQEKYKALPDPLYDKAHPKASKK